MASLPRVAPKPRDESKPKPRAFVTQPDPTPFVRAEQLSPQANETSQSTLLLQKKREMTQVQQALDRKKDEYRQRMQACQEKEIELSSKQGQLKDRVSKFDKFLRDNDTKKKRAEKKETEEVGMLGEKMGEIKDLTVKLSGSTAERDEKETILVHDERYERFLLQVCDTAEYFQEITDILMRHATLVASSDDLLKRVTTVSNEAEVMRATLATYLKDAQTETLVLNSECALLQKQLEEANQTVEAREVVISRNEGGAKERSRVLGEIGFAIENIYARCERTKANSVKDKEGSEQLDVAEMLPLLGVIESRVTGLQAVMRSLHDFRKVAPPMLPVPPMLSVPAPEGQQPPPPHGAPPPALPQALAGGGGSVLESPGAILRRPSLKAPGHELGLPLSSSASSSADSRR